MRNFKQMALKAAFVPAILAATAGAAFAEGEIPTTAVALAQTVKLDDAKSAGLIIVGLMVTAGVVLWGARLVMSKFKPKI